LASLPSPPLRLRLPPEAAIVLASAIVWSALIMAGHYDPPSNRVQFGAPLALAVFAISLVRRPELRSLVDAGMRAGAFVGAVVGGAAAAVVLRPTLLGLAALIVEVGIIMALFGPIWAALVSPMVLVVRRARREPSHDGPDAAVVVSMSWAFAISAVVALRAAAQGNARGGLGAALAAFVALALAAAGQWVRRARARFVEDVRRGRARGSWLDRASDYEAQRGLFPAGVGAPCDGVVVFEPSRAPAVAESRGPRSYREPAPLVAVARAAEAAPQLWATVPLADDGGRSVSLLAHFRDHGVPRVQLAVFGALAVLVVVAPLFRGR
jgi:hypothetical protein